MWHGDMRSHARISYTRFHTLNAGDCPVDIVLYFPLYRATEALTRSYRLWTWLLFSQCTSPSYPVPILYDDDMFFPRSFTVRRLHIPQHTIGGKDLAWRWHKFTSPVSLTSVHWTLPL